MEKPLENQLVHQSNLRELQSRGYQIINEIGNGTYSRVFKAEQIRAKSQKDCYKIESKEKETDNFSLARFVAIKFINHKTAPDQFKIKFLPREIDVVRSITHKNIVEAKEILCSPDNATYIITEYCPKGDLLNYICLRGALPESQTRSYFQNIISALEYLHGIDVVHRDIKCENLLVYNDAKSINHPTVLKLTDFGFSREIFDNQMSSTFCGSPAYVAPEIIKGKPYDPRITDLWSCAVVLYIMSFSSMPFDDSNLTDLLLQQSGKLRRVGKVSDGLYEFLEELLKFEIKDRLTLKTLKSSDWYMAID